MMPNESTDDRRYYAEQFARVHERLDEIHTMLADMRVECTRRHAHDGDVMHLMQGNGKPPLVERLALLEQAEPRQRESKATLLSVAAIIGTAVLAVVEWVKR
jgi:hypothetical protein